MSKPNLVIVKPIYYRPIERYWYRLTDAVQPRWRRFADSRWGYWFGRLLVLLARIAKFLGAAIFIVGFGVAYLFFMFAFSGGKRMGRRR